MKRYQSFAIVGAFALIFSLMSTAFILNAYASSHASDGNQNMVEGAAKSPDLVAGGRPHVKAIIECARTILNQNRGGEKGVEVAAGFLERARRNRGSVEKLWETKTACIDNQRSLPKLSISKSAQIEAAKMLGNNYSPATRQMINDFITPTVNCTGIGGSSNVAIIFSFSLSNSLNLICRSSDGRKWSGIRMGAGIGGGLVGVNASLNLGSNRLTTYRRGPIDITSSNNVNTGTFINVMGETNSSGSTKLGTSGLGIGLGATANTMRELNVTLLPLGNDWDSLVNRLLTNN